jgi:high affinity sulfate transporter 1
MSEASRIATLIPALGWFARYRRDWLLPDVLAGLTTAAVVIPKAMAYATIAGLPPQVGLYTAFVPMIVYAVLGSSATLSVSTTTTIAILSASAIADLGGSHPELGAAAATATLAVLVGLMLVAARLLRLGFVASFISDPVLTGFKAGIGLVIVLDQVPKLLGIHIDKSGFFRDAFAILGELGHVSLPTLAVAGASFAAIALLHASVPRAPAPLLVVAAAIATSAMLGLDDAGVAVVGAIPGGLPALSLPVTGLFETLWPAAAGIALMSFTESIAAARAFPAPEAPRIDANQELLGTGAANLIGGLFGAMPGGGGTSQTAVNTAAGARSPLAGVVTAAAALATMLFLAPAMGALPYAALAAVVVAYSLGLIDPLELREILRVRRMEFFWALAALAGVVVLGTLKGILVAVLLSLLSLMYQGNNPQVYAVRRVAGSRDFEPVEDGRASDPELPGLLIARIVGRVYFGNVQVVGERVRALAAQARPRVLLLDCRAVLDFEYTALKALVNAERELRALGVELWLAALNPEPLAQVRQSSLAATLGTQRMHASLHGAVGAYAAREDAAGVQPAAPAGGPAC